MKYVLRMSGTKADFDWFTTWSKQDLEAYFAFMHAFNTELKDSGVLVAAEDDAGLLACRVLVKKATCGGEVLGTSIKVAAEERGRPYFLSALNLVCHKTVAGFLYSFVESEDFDQG